MIQEIEFAPDSPLEGTGFEPSVPLLRKVSRLLPKGDAGCRRRAETSSTRSARQNGASTPGISARTPRRKSARPDMAPPQPLVIVRDVVIAREEAYLELARVLHWTSTVLSWSQRRTAVLKWR